MLGNHYEQHDMQPINDERKLLIASCYPIVRMLSRPKFAQRTDVLLHLRLLSQLLLLLGVHDVYTPRIQPKVTIIASEFPSSAIYGDIGAGS